MGEIQQAPLGDAALARRRRPRWSLKTVFFGGLVIAGFSLLLVHGLGRGDLWREMEWVAGGAAVALLPFFAVALYRGVRWLPRERVTLAWRAWPAGARVGQHASLEFAFTPHADGLGSLVVCLLLDLFLSVVLAFLVVTLWWLGVNLALATFAAVFVPLFALFRRSVRTVLARGRACHGDLPRSLGHGLLWAAVYGGWFYGVLALIGWWRR